MDFVLTFEELQGMFEAKEIDFETIEPMYDLNEGTAAGRGFAVSGGVAGAVANQYMYTGKRGMKKTLTKTLNNIRDLVEELGEC